MESSREEGMRSNYISVSYPLLAGLVLSLLWAAPHAVAGESPMKGAAAPGALDGKVFVVQTGEMGKKAEEKDTLSFRNGKFHSAGCDKYGFGDAAYRTSSEGDAVTFTAETVSATKGKIRWEGTVRGDQIDVRYVWTDSPHWYKPNPKPLEKWAKGERKKSEDRANPGAGPPLY